MLHLANLFALLPLLASMAAESRASPISRREVPQELSHKKYLTATQASLQLDNPAGIVDPVFGLLGNAAAAKGAGSITNLDCLQQATADQAFTNAKAANDVDGMTAALVYRALERNTLGIGLESATCIETAKNPEIAAISQHQDPASAGAGAKNKAIALELAKQIASVGGNPLTALDAGTFTPGDKNDNTFAGNTCDDANDAEGCIFTRNLLVPDATEEEILAAVGAGAGTGINDGAAAAPGVELAESASPSAATASPSSAVTASATPSPAASASASPTAVGTATAQPGTSDPSSKAAYKPAGTGAQAGIGAVAGGNNGAAAGAQGIDVGPCTNFAMLFQGGNDGRPANQFTFIPADQTQFPGQQSALNPNIIANFMCDNFVNRCAKSAATRDACKTVAADLASREGAGELKRDQGFADAWLTGVEGAFGITSVGAGSGGNDVAAGADASAGNAANKENNANNANNANGGEADKAGQDTAARPGIGSAAGNGEDTSGAAGTNEGVAGGQDTAGGAGAAGIDVGTCTDFSMSFTGGNDGRAADEFTFIPTDRASFPQGSALNPNIITNAMCDGFVNGCGESAATRDVCKTVAADLAAKEAAGQLQRDQGFADAWLTELQTAFGIQSTGQGSAGGAAGANTGADASAGADAGAAAGNGVDAAVGDANAAAGAEAPAGMASRPQAHPQPPVAGPAVEGNAKEAGKDNKDGNGSGRDEADKGHGAGKDDKEKGMGPDVKAAAGGMGPGAAGAKGGKAENAMGPAQPGAAGKGNKLHMAMKQGGAMMPGKAAGAGAESKGAAEAGAAAGAMGQQHGTMGGDVAASGGGAESSAAGAAGVNVQSFTGELNGVAAPPVIGSSGNRPFSVNGATFQNIGTAINRSCAIQHNACANSANTGGAAKVAECDAQEKTCLAAGQSAARLRRSRVFRA